MSDENIPIRRTGVLNNGNLIDRKQNRFRNISAANVQDASLSKISQSVRPVETTSKTKSKKSSLKGAYSDLIEEIENAI